MAVLFFEEDKYSSNLNLRLKRIFNIINLRQVDERIICKLPIRKNQELNVKKQKLIIDKILENNNIKYAVLSKALEKNIKLKDELLMHNIAVLDGNKLFNLLLYDIINEIYNIANKKMETGKIAILVNNCSSDDIENIIRLAKKVKKINIITKNIQKFKKIEEYLYEELGIIMQVSNNMNKDLENAEIILNIDFSKDLISKLPRKCIIININNKIKTMQKKFSGININNFAINIPEKIVLQGYDNNIVYESYIVEKDYDQAIQQLKNDNIKVIDLIGNNGKINKKEFIALFAWQIANSGVI